LPLSRPARNSGVIADGSEYYPAAFLDVDIFWRRFLGADPAYPAKAHSSIGSPDECAVDSEFGATELSSYRT
jgi:hypothetical protein